jgi:hypothetical protein
VLAAKVWAASKAVTYLPEYTTRAHPRPQGVPSSARKEGRGACFASASASQQHG